MNPAQRYASYSMDDLRDVEKRIDRARFPEAYAALRAEIEKRVGDAPPAEPEPAWAKEARRRCRDLIRATYVGCALACAVLWWQNLRAPQAPAPGYTVRLRSGFSCPSGAYLSPEQKALRDCVCLFLWPGLPGALALRALLGPDEEQDQEGQGTGAST